MRKSYRNIAFLSELLVNILVFSVSCAILVGVFGKASQVARQNREENLATLEAYALIEMVRAKGFDDIDEGHREADGTLVCLYDRDWQPVRQDGMYALTLRAEPEVTAGGTLLRLTAQATSLSGPRAGQEICTLSSSVYFPEGGVAP